MARIKVFDECIFYLSRLPGICNKTATRLAMYILSQDENFAIKLAESIQELRLNTVFCSVCGCISSHDICDICQDEHRDKTTLCVVEEAKDILAIEQTSRFHGVYHALGGKLSPIDGVGPENLRISDLIKRLNEGAIKEVIIATNHDVEGDTTALYLSKVIGKYDRRIIPSVRIW